MASLDDARASLPATDSANLCILAKRVPKVIPTGDENADRELQDNRAALVGIIQFLHNSPRKTVPTFLALTRGDIKEGLHSKQEWPDSYSCVQKYPKYFKAQLLMADSGNSLTKLDFNNINTKDPEAITSIFNLCAQVRDSTCTPREIINKAWSAKVFLLRLRICRHRIRTLKSSGALKADGTIDYAKWAAYTIIWGEDGKATGVRHISGDEAAFEPGQNVTEEYNLKNPLDEMQTKLSKGASSISLPDLFAKDKGPWRFDIGKPKKSQSDAFRELSKQLGSTPSAEHPEVVEPDPKYLTCSDEALKGIRREKAKQRLQEEGPARKKRKTVALK